MDFSTPLFVQPPLPSWLVFRISSFGFRFKETEPRKRSSFWALRCRRSLPPTSSSCRAPAFRATARFGARHVVGITKGGPALKQHEARRPKRGKPTRTTKLVITKSSGFGFGLQVTRQVLWSPVPYGKPLHFTTKPIQTAH